MQFSTLLLASVCLYHHQVAAFYPYIPKGWGDIASLTHHDKASRNRLPSMASSGKSVTLPLRCTYVPRRSLLPRDSIYNMVSAVQPTQENSVGIDQDETDYTYMSVMKLGTSQTEYHMLLDTAASNTWVMSSECTTYICTSHNTFGPDVSSSLQTTQETFTVTYGTGNVNGTVVTDDAHFAGLTVPLTFGLARGVSQEFYNFPLDGIVGLGRSDSDTTGTNAPSIVEVLAQKNLIDAKVIGVHLGRHASPPIDGELNLGAPNPNRYDGDLRYITAEASNRGFWELPIEDAGVDDKSAGLSGRFAIIDTGTSFILLPPNDAAKIHELIPGSKLNGDAYTVPCDTTAIVQFTFGGRMYDVLPVDYVGRNSDKGGCNSQIIARRTFDENQWLVGDVFLKNVYTVFDYDQGRIGFGTKGGDQTPDESGDSSPTEVSVGPSATAPPASSSPSSPSLSLATLPDEPSPSVTSSLESSLTLLSAGPSASTPTAPEGATVADQQNGPATTTSVGAASSNVAVSKPGVMLALGVAMGGLIAVV